MVFLMSRRVSSRCAEAGTPLVSCSSKCLIQTVPAGSNVTLTVVAPGGAQTVTWDGPGTELRLTGPATLISRGEAWTG